MGRAVQFRTLMYCFTFWELTQTFPALTAVPKFSSLLFSYQFISLLIISSPLLFLFLIASSCLISSRCLLSSRLVSSCPIRSLPFSSLFFLSVLVSSWVFAYYLLLRLIPSHPFPPLEKAFSSHLLLSLLVSPALFSSHLFAYSLIFSSLLDTSLVSYCLFSKMKREKYVSLSIFSSHL